MMQNKLISLSLMSLLLLQVGCASLSGAQAQTARNAAWMGANLDAVVMQWGASNRNSTLSDGRVVHTWVSESTEAGAGVYPSIGISGGTGGFGIGTGITLGGGLPKVVRCERTFTFKDNMVVDQNWIGADHYCNNFARKTSKP